MTDEEREELGLPLRQADPDTFKHEPADYEAVTVEQLKPCPFCGGQAQPSLAQMGGTEWAQVECVERNCGACGPTPATEAEAIAAWNTRTQANEAMREALERIAATDFDSPPWQAVEAEIKQIALSALSGDSA